MRTLAVLAIFFSFIWSGSSAAPAPVPAASANTSGASETAAEKARREEERVPLLIGVHVTTNQDRLQVSIPEITRRLVKRLSRKKEVRAVAIADGSVDDMQTEARNQGCDYFLGLSLREEQAAVIRMGNSHPLGQPGDDRERDSGWQLAVRYRLEAITRRASSYQNDFKVSEERSPDLQARFSAGEIAADQILKQIARKD